MNGSMLGYGILGVKENRKIPMTRAFVPGGYSTRFQMMKIESDSI